MRPQLERTLNAALEILCHAVQAALFLTMIKGLELLLHFYWSDNELMFFGWLPARYIFHGMDVAVLTAFSISGVWRTIAALMGEE